MFDVGLPLTASGLHVLIPELIFALRFIERDGAGQARLLLDGVGRFDMNHVAHVTSRKTQQAQDEEGDDEQEDQVIGFHNDGFLLLPGEGTNVRLSNAMASSVSNGITCDVWL